MTEVDVALLKKLSSSGRITPRPNQSVRMSMVDKSSNTGKLFSARYYRSDLFCQDCVSDDGSLSRKRCQTWKVDGEK